MAHIPLGQASLNSPRLVLEVEGTFQAGGFKLAAPSCIINVYIVYCRHDVKIRTVILLYYSPTKKCENKACDFSFKLPFIKNIYPFNIHLKY